VVTVATTDSGCPRVTVRPADPSGVIRQSCGPDGHVRVIPARVAAQVGSVLDPALFDVTTLIQDGERVCDSSWELRPSSCELTGTAPFFAVLNAPGGFPTGPYALAFARVDGAPGCPVLPRTRPAPSRRSMTRRGSVAAVLPDRPAIARSPVLYRQAQRRSSWKRMPLTPPTSSLIAMGARPLPRMISGTGRHHAGAGSFLPVIRHM
jgi:hypothetical protein